MRTDKRRLAVIERSLATPWTAFRRADGAKVLVPDQMAVDAFLHALGGEPLGMGDGVEAFLATCEPDGRAPDVEYLVVAVARQHAGLVNAAPERSHAPLGALVDSVDDPDEGSEGGIGELLEVEAALVRAARSQEWLEEHYPAPSPSGLDIDLGAN